jgi:hypothetical protein
MTPYLREMKALLSRLFACWSADLVAESDRRKWDVTRIKSMLEMTKNEEERARLEAELKQHELVLKALPIAMEYRETEMGREMHRRRQKMEREVADLEVAWRMGGQDMKEKLSEAEDKLAIFNELEAERGWELLARQMA